MLTERQEEVLKAWNDSGQQQKKAAKKLGISVSNLRKNLFYIAIKGVKISNATYNEHLPPGWGYNKTTLSVKVDEDGNERVVHYWPRGAPIKENTEALFEYLKTRVPVSPIQIPMPIGVDPDIQLEWTLADVHYGMLAWREETGEDYDIKIARSLILDSASDIFARAGRVKETVLVFMGDNWHTDFYSGQTEDNKNPLDVDSRFPKMIKTGIETFINAAEICLQFSETVKIIVLYGNHDKQTSTILPLILDIYFKNEPRVFVDLNPAKAHYNYWGNSATMYHHGDKTTKQRLCSDFALHCAKNGIKAEYFYVKQGHLHKELVEDVNGVIYEIVPSPLAKEYYSASSAYASKRATVATMYHKEYGELDRYSITPHALKLKKDKLLTMDY